jgi:hypothetical protein
MTDDLEALQRRLEKATARPSPAEDAVDAETAALRAGWLALGELLEAAPPQADPLSRPAGPPVPRRRRWLPAAMAVLAASILIAVIVPWSLRGTKSAVAPAPPQLAQVAGSHPRPSSAAASAERATPPQTAQHAPPAARPSEPWDDSLDQEIAAAAEAIASVQDGWRGDASDPSAIEYQLQQIRKDIENGTL